jgi:hypothetical protein
VAVRALGRGKASGVEIGRTAGRPRSANVFELRGGKVTRLVSYFDRDRALADLGLNEFSAKTREARDSCRRLASR